MAVVFKNVKLLGIEEFLRTKENKVDEILESVNIDLIIAHKRKCSKISFYRSDGAVLIQRGKPHRMLWEEKLEIDLPRPNKWRTV